MLRTANDGTLNWTFDSSSVAGEAFDHLAVGESLVLDYTVVVTDSQGVTAEQVVSDHHQRQQRCAGHCPRRRRQRERVADRDG
ncbi:hypothetical protein [Cobetia sp. ICG0124]|uniref:hypothetical protein n=1 Tax=Cobetia sp. ICG0124 TaxID=2053669 RepID=UPI000FDAB2C8|nr:hypothetical protein [Cobetia sp. ICG0124]